MVAIEVIFGWMASTLTTLILLPQIVKTLKTRHTDDLSMFMLILSVAGNGSWVVHAVLTGNMPLIVGAGLISMMSIILIICKFLYDTK